MSEKWAAEERYAQGCGHSGCVGFDSRDDAIAWLHKNFRWNLCWYLSPTWEVYKIEIHTPTGAD